MVSLFLTYVSSLFRFINRGRGGGRRGLERFQKIEGLDEKEVEKTFRETIDTSATTIDLIFTNTILDFDAQSGINKNDVIEDLISFVSLGQL